MDAETHNIPSRGQKRKGSSERIKWLVGMGLHNTRGIVFFLALLQVAQIYMGIVFSVYTGS